MRWQSRLERVTIDMLGHQSRSRWSDHDHRDRRGLDQLRVTTIKTANRENLEDCGVN